MKIKFNISIHTYIQVANEMSKHRKEKCHEKVQHGYLLRETKDNEDICQKKSSTWLINRKFSSHIDGYLLAIQEQEIDTGTLRRIQEKDPLKRKEMPRHAGYVEKLRKTFFISLYPAPTCLVTCTCITNTTQWPKHCIKKLLQK